MNFPEILRNERLKAHLKQSELGERIGVSVQVLSTYETGIREPKLKTLIRIADEFNLSLDNLVGRDMSLSQNREKCSTESYEEEHLLEMFRSLTEEDKEKVLAIVRTLYDIGKPIQENDFRSEKSPASAG